MRELAMVKVHFVVRGLLRCVPLGIALLCIAPAMAQDADKSAPKKIAVPLIELEPHDIIVLDKENGGQHLNVLPLDFPERRVPEDPPGDSKLQFEWSHRPGPRYEVAWRNIVEVKLFEQMVLEEARNQVKNEKFDEAYRAYAFMLLEYPNTPGLSQAIEDFLWQSAASAYTKNGGRRSDAALATLLALWERNPDYPRLESALSILVERLISEYDKAGNFSAARGMIELLQGMPGQKQRATANKWEQDFTRRADGILREARGEFDRGEYQAARESVVRAMRVWPATPGIRELYLRIREKFSQVVVGVTQPAVFKGLPPAVCRLDDWALRRVRQLVDRPLIRLVRYGAEGAVYSSSLGTFQESPSGKQLLLQVRPDNRWTWPSTEAATDESAAITGYDVARRLRDVAQANHPAYQPDWADWFAGVSVQNVYRVRIDLKRPHSRPEALLPMGLRRRAGAKRNEPLASYGPYFISGRDKDAVRYRLSAQYAFPPGSTPPTEIIERTYRDSDVAVEALMSGEIMALDRVAPWDISVLEKHPDIEVVPYALPMLHVLIPNQRRELGVEISPDHPKALVAGLLRNRQFRRALLYGIEKNIILRQELSSREADRSVVISGPFPARTSYDDPISYGSDDDIKPYPYDPRQALVLSISAMMEILKSRSPSKGSSPSGAGKEAKGSGGGEATAEEDKEQQPPLPEFPELVLAHPAEPVARAACEAIRLHLGMLQIPIKLKELEPGELNRRGANAPDYDLLYAELAVWEPVADASRLLASDIVPGGPDSHMSLALWQLARATDSKQIREKLHEIHALVSADLPIMPLWQMVPHFAHRRDVRGLTTGSGVEAADRPATLYQNVEHWTTEAHIPHELR